MEINEVVENALGLLRSDLTRRGVSITFDPQPNLPTLTGDRVQIKQVLLNLIINGCDAMENADSGRHMTVRTQRVPGPAVEVSVSDHGSGIAPDDLERIFTPFVTSKGKGIGLGLSICRTIVQAHGGKLWASNNPDRGATLHVWLPVSAAGNAGPSGIG